MASFPTSYIPTTSSTVTRAADVASIASIQPWFTASLTDHTFYFETRSTGNKSNAIALEGYESTSLKGFTLGLAGTGEAPRLIQRHGSSRFDTAASLPSVSLGSRIKAAARTSASSGGALNGSALTFGPAPSQEDWTSASGLSIGSRTVGSSLTYTGTIARICYWKTPLPDATLQTITQ